MTQEGQRGRTGSPDSQDLIDKKITLWVTQNGGIGTDLRNNIRQGNSAEAKNPTMSPAIAHIIAERVATV